MVREINQLNEKRKILKTPAVEVTDVYESKVRDLIADLLATAQANTPDCVGLAANQIWTDEENPPFKIFVAKIPINKQQEESGQEVWNVFINPIAKGSGKKIIRQENCLSKKSYRSSFVKRDKNCTLTWIDENKNEYEVKFSGLLSIIVQHETDHLKGKLI